jgi:hypothetical protein
MPRGPAKDQSFEKFYYAKVGLGEGCGCAERVIDVHEFNRLAGKPKRVFRIGKPNLKASLRRFLNAAGLSRRPSR